MGLGLVLLDCYRQAAIHRRAEGHFQVCRCRSDELRHATVQAIRHEIEAICERRGVNCSMIVKHEAPAAACHPAMIASLVDACRASEQVPPRSCSWLAMSCS